MIVTYTRVRYSCSECGLRRVELDVPARGDEDVREWMDATVKRTWQDHAKRSPQCHQHELKELLIPMVGRDRIGGPELQ